jgi:hypothetical protein
MNVNDIIVTDKNSSSLYEGNLKISPLGEARFKRLVRDGAMLMFGSLRAAHMASAVCAQYILPRNKKITVKKTPWENGVSINGMRVKQVVLFVPKIDGFGIYLLTYK